MKTIGIVPMIEPGKSIAVLRLLELAAQIERGEIEVLTAHSNRTGPSIGPVLHLSMCSNFKEFTLGITEPETLTLDFEFNRLRKPEPISEERLAEVLALIKRGEGECCGT